jgi:hypothetical protein
LEFCGEVCGGFLDEVVEVFVLFFFLKGADLVFFGDVFVGLILPVEEFVWGAVKCKAEVVEFCKGDAFKVFITKFNCLVTRVNPCFTRMNRAC